jgi:glutaredoxin 2
MILMPDGPFCARARMLMSLPAIWLETMVWSIDSEVDVVRLNPRLAVREMPRLLLSIARRVWLYSTFFGQ